jgi:hypothetical protein
MNQLSDTRKLRLILSKIILCLSLVVWFGFAGLFEHYCHTRPTVPNLDEGRTYEENQHGYYFYLTKEEHSRLMTLMIAAPVLFAAGALIDPVRRWWPGRPTP